ncbi:MAG: metallophosphatase family protein [Desulfobulbaceae bacterium]
MKIAVLSDIHGNLEALEAVISDLKMQGADRVICLGDNIGYGPDPEEVVQLIQNLGYESILGNHEFALMDQRGRRWFNFQATENSIETEKLLSTESRKYCCTLPSFLEIGNAHFVHGYPPVSVFRYLNRQSDEKIVSLFKKTSADIYFLGHTHTLQLVTCRDQVVYRRSLGQEKNILQPGSKYIVNGGSVGQPRDGDNRAKYLLWDYRNCELEVRFIDYDRGLTMKKIRERCFPEIYAMRLR